MVKKPFLYVGFVLVLAIIFLGRFFLLKNGNSSCSFSKDEATIVMKESTYEPQHIEITRCTKVTFKNEASAPRWPASDIHPTHGIYPEFDPKEPVAVGNSWSFVFNKVGNWRYHDHLNPTEIRGVISVIQ